MITFLRDGLMGPLTPYHVFGIILAFLLTVAVVALHRRVRPGNSVSYPPLVLFWSWLVLSIMWIVGVVYAESLDGHLSEELPEVAATALLPTVVPPLVITVVVRIREYVSRR